MRLAERSDPLYQSHRELADVLLSAGRFDESERQCEHLPADSAWRNECLGRARLAQGRIEDAIPLLAANPTYNWGYLAYAYAKAGQRARAGELMDEGPKLYPDKRGAFQFALVFAGFGDTDRPLERLERLAPVGAARHWLYSEQSRIRVSAGRPAHEGAAQEGRIARVEKLAPGQVQSDH